jgi:hypothetical protein
MPVYLTHILFTAATRIVLVRLGVEGLLPHVLLGTAAGLAGPLIFAWCANRLRISALLGFTAPKRAA